MATLQSGEVPTLVAEGVVVRHVQHQPLVTRLGERVRRASTLGSIATWIAARKGGALGAHEEIRGMQKGNKQHPTEEGQIYFKSIDLAMTKMKTRMRQALQKGSLVRRSLTLSACTTFLIMMIAVFRFFMVGTVGAPLDLAVRFLVSVVALYVFFFFFYVVYLFFNPGTYPPKDSDSNK
jgi:hypothetical protein